MVIESDYRCLRVKERCPYRENGAAGANIKHTTIEIKLLNRLKPILSCGMQTSTKGHSRINHNHTFTTAFLLKPMFLPDRADDKLFAYRKRFESFFPFRQPIFIGKFLDVEGAQTLAESIFFQ